MAAVQLAIGDDFQSDQLLQLRIMKRIAAGSPQLKRSVGSHQGNGLMFALAARCELLMNDFSLIAHLHDRLAALKRLCNHSFLEFYRLNAANQS